jgi:uncharacterized protein (TIGR02246 family)
MKTKPAQGGIPMNYFRILLWCVVLLFSICGCAKRGIPGDRSEDERKVQELEIAASKALAARDLGGLVSLYDDDAALYDDRDPSIRGKHAIREAWRAAFAKSGVNLSTEPQSVEISKDGDLAWAHGKFLMETNNAAGKPVFNHWEYALVYTKQADGKWKIMADSAYSYLLTYLFHKPPKGQSPYSPLAPLIGLACLASGIWFLIGMPIVAFVCAWNFCRNRKLSTGFVVSAVMFMAFFVAALLLWWNISAHYWNLSFMTTFYAAVDTARYGNPVEDTAESVLVTLLVLSTFSALAAGVITGSARWAWIRHRRLK